METTKSTKVDVANDTPERFEESKKAALKVLESETEILRLKDKGSRLKIVKMMLEDTNQQIKDRIAGIRRDASVSQLEDIFKSSSRRSNCSDAQLETYCRYIKILEERLGGSVLARSADSTLFAVLSSRVVSPQASRLQSCRQANDGPLHASAE